MSAARERELLFRFKESVDELRKLGFRLGYSLDHPDPVRSQLIDEVVEKGCKPALVGCSECGRTVDAARFSQPPCE